jgi:hypothetical protein
VRTIILRSAQSTAERIVDRIDIAHGRVGKADINQEYYFDQNLHLIFHDSMGFKPGSTQKSAIVKSFLQGRAERNAELLDQVHAIW